MIRLGGGNPNPAPGPDGIPMVLWRKIPHAMMERLAGIYSVCLRSGVFPKQ